MRSSRASRTTRPRYAPVTFLRRFRAPARTVPGSPARPRRPAPPRCSPTAAGAELAAPTGLPVLVADEPRALLGALSAAVWGDPTAGMLVLGVTGTNGKTTTAYLLEEGLRAAGHTTGLVGTIETRVAGESVPSIRTTPEATDLQAAFAAMAERGRDRGRDRGLQPRAGARPGRRHPVHGRRVHQPVPGPPGLPPRHGGLLRGQGAAVRRPLRARGRHRRRPVRAAAGEAGHGDRVRGR